MQDIAKKLTEHRKKAKPIIDQAQKFINQGVPIDDFDLLNTYESLTLEVARLYANLISKEPDQRLVEDLYALFITLEPKFGCGESDERERYIAKHMADAIERHYT